MFSYKTDHCEINEIIHFELLIDHCLLQLASSKKERLLIIYVVFAGAGTIKIYRYLISLDYDIT